MTKLLQDLRNGKKLKIKHPEYQFTINALLKMEDGKTEPSISGLSVSLPQKANRGEKLLLKLVQIYCYDVLCNNLHSEVVKSTEYQKLMAKLGKQ